MSEDRILPKISPSAQATNIPPLNTQPPATFQAKLINKPLTVETSDYLSYCKSLQLDTDPRFAADTVDKQLLEFLYVQCRGDISVAKFLILSELSAGLNLKYRRTLKARSRHRRSHLPKRAVLEKVNWSEYYLRDYPAYLGDLRAGEVGSRGAYAPPEILECERDVDFLASNLGLVDDMMDTEQSNQLAPSTSTSTSGMMERISSIQSIGGDSVGSSRTRGAPRGSLVDRTEVKVRWRSLVTQGKLYLKAVETQINGQSVSEINKPSLCELCSLLQTAYSMPMPTETPGETFVEETIFLLNRILRLISQARDVLAELYDSTYIEDENDYIELDRVRMALKDARKLVVRMDETELIHSCYKKAVAWQNDLDSLLEQSATVITDGRNVSNGIDFIAQAESMLNKSDELVPLHRIKGRVMLEKKLRKAREARDRVNEWKNCLSEDKKDTVKAVAALLREVGRVGLYFPEMQQLAMVNKATEEWMQRFSVLMRGRAALKEIDEMINQGNEMPVKLSEHIEKLRKKGEKGYNWVRSFKQKLPKTDELLHSQRYVELLEYIRDEILSGTQREKDLSDLCAMGATIPLEIDLYKFLNTSVKATQWTEQAKKFLDCNEYPSLDDLKSHLEAGKELRSLLPLNSRERNIWPLSLEKSLTSLVAEADACREKHRRFLVDATKRVSIEEVRNLFDEIVAIKVNLNDIEHSTERLLVDTGKWAKAHEKVLVRCGVHPNLNNEYDMNVPLSFNDIQAALTSYNISVRLEEFIQLQRICYTIEEWIGQVAIVISHIKRDVLIPKGENKSSYETVQLLINQSCSLPIDVSEQVKILSNELERIEEWRTKSREILKGLSENISREIDMRMRPSADSNSENEDIEGRSETSSLGGHNHFTRRGTAVALANENIDRNEPVDPKSMVIQTMSSSESFLVETKKVINDRLVCADAITIYTPEEHATGRVSEVINWYEKCIKNLSPQAVILGGPYELDDLIKKGQVLNNDDSNDSTQKTIVHFLHSSWRKLIDLEQTRLDKLRRYRNEFIAWNAKAKAFIGGSSEKLSVTAMDNLLLEAERYPEDHHTVKSLKESVKRAKQWCEDAQKALESTQKVSMERMKDLISQGEQSSLYSQELKNLRQQLRVAKQWSAKVRKTLTPSGDTSTSPNLKSLHEEYKTFIIEMLPEMKLLQDATNSYCICRETHTSGFMIACDTCEEWYHGVCVGVTQSQADRCSKYICIRCSLCNTYKASTHEAIDIVKKWMDWREVMKARSVDSQKYQRKSRRERRELEKKQEEFNALKKLLGHRQKNGDTGETESKKNPGVGQEPDDGSFLDASNSAIMKSLINSPVLRKLSDSIANPACSSDERKGDIIAEEVQPLELPAAMEVDSTTDPASLQKKPVSKDSIVIASKVTEVKTAPNDDEHHTNISLSNTISNEKNVMVVISSSEVDGEQQPIKSEPVLKQGKERGDYSLSENEHTTEDTEQVFDLNNEVDKITAVEMAAVPTLKDIDKDIDATSEDLNRECDQNTSSADLAESNELKDSELFGRKDDYTKMPLFELETRLDRMKVAIINYSTKLDQFNKFLEEYKENEENENSLAKDLRTWLRKVLRTIFIPPDEATALSSYPLKKIAMESKPINVLIQEVKEKGLSKMPDVKAVVNTLKTIVWIYDTLLIVAKKPHIDELVQICNRLDHLTIPNEKLEKTLRSITNKAVSWQEKVKAALSPTPWSTKPYSVAALSQLAKLSHHFPCTIPEEIRILHAIDDKGMRHCHCGGPSDGSYMVMCDKCEVWFHGKCVNLTKSQGDLLSTYICTKCCKTHHISSTFIKPSDMNTAALGSSDLVEPHPPPLAPKCLTSPYAPDLEKLWPPIDCESKFAQEVCNLLENLGSPDADEEFKLRINERKKEVRPYKRRKPKNEPTERRLKAPKIHQGPPASFLAPVTIAIVPEEMKAVQGVESNTSDGKLADVIKSKDPKIKESAAKKKQQGAKPGRPPKNVNFPLPTQAERIQRANFQAAMQFPLNRMMVAPTSAFETMFGMHGAGRGRGRGTFKFPNFLPTAMMMAPKPKTTVATNTPVENAPSTSQSLKTCTKKEKSEVDKFSEQVENVDIEKMNSTTSDFMNAAIESSIDGGISIDLASTIEALKKSSHDDQSSPKSEKPLSEVPISKNNNKEEAAVEIPLTSDLFSLATKEEASENTEEATEKQGTTIKDETLQISVPSIEVQVKVVQSQDEAEKPTRTTDEEVEK